MMKAYQIVVSEGRGKASDTLKALEIKVNTLLAEGWVCQGGPFLVNGSFRQAMVK